MKHQWKPLLMVASVFLFTGATICMNDILLPSVKDLFHLSYVEASFVQQSFFLVYLLFPLPIAWYISRYGYKTGIITALLICSAASLLFIPAYYNLSYPLVLVALFIMSTGVTLINVAANPLAALLGSPEGAHVRVNIVQLFSRIGFSFTPMLATRLMQINGGGTAFHFPYLLIGAGTFFLMVLFVFSSLRIVNIEVTKAFSLGAIVRESKKYPRLRWGIAAMFFYMGAEACTAGFFISYLREVAGFESGLAARYLTYYYVASSVVSFIAIYLISRTSPGKLLAWFAAGMVLMYLLAALTRTSFNAWYMIGMGVFISILFALIFSLSIAGLGRFTEKGSALVNMAVVGGAVFPPVQGWIADALGIQFSYLVPGLCMVAVILYGIFCFRNSGKSV